jgi:hypothetical protein
MTTTDLSGIDHLAAVLPALSDLVDTMWHQQLDAPTASGTTVREELDRLMVLGATYTYWFRGEQPPELTAPVTYGWVPAAEFREVMDDLFAAVSAPGALDRTLTTAAGTVTASDFARAIAAGAVLHGRELAAAIGAHFDADPAALAALDPFAAAA